VQFYTVTFKQLVGVSSKRHVDVFQAFAYLLLWHVSMSMELLIIILLLWKLCTIIYYTMSLVILWALF